MRLGFVLAVLGSVACVGSASAHFQVLLPETALLQAVRDDLNMTVAFTHPAAGGPMMDMGTPEALYLLKQRGDDAEPERVDLLEALSPMTFQGADGTSAAAYNLTVPRSEVRSLGDYIFVLEPAPFFEASEDKYIQQFTKTVVNNGGVPGGWAEEVGLPAEIVPLDKPYANWAGGVFRGIVLANGEPVPFAEIEVEHINYAYNDDKSAWIGEPFISAPHPALETFSIRADAQGNFTVGLPMAGWWGIGALDVNPGTEFEGKPLSQDAVIWVQVSDVGQ